MLECSSAHIVSCLFMCCSFASIGHAYIMCSTVSSNCLQHLHLLFLSVIFLLHDIWLVMPNLMLLLFHSKFLLSDLLIILIITIEDNR